MWVEEKIVLQAFLLGCKAFTLGLEAEEEAILEKRKVAILEIDHLYYLVMAALPVCLPVAC